MSDIIWLFFSAWLISSRMIPSKFIHAVATGKTAFLFRAEQYSIVFIVLARQKPGWWSTYELAASLVDSRCLLVAPTAGETTWVDGKPWAEPFQGWPERSGVGMSGVLGGDERPKGAGLLHHVGWTRSGGSTGDQRWHGQLTSCAVTPALQAMCTSWTPWPRGVGVLGCVLNVYSVEPSQPGLTFLLRDSCSRQARLRWSPGASRTATWTGNLAVAAGHRHSLLCPPPTGVSGFGGVSCTIWASSQR